MGSDNPRGLLFEARKAVPHEVQEMPAHPVRFDECRLALGEACFQLRSLPHAAEITPSYK